MTYAKRENFPKRFQELSSFARAFSHPARLTILDMLARSGEMISGEICDRIPLSRETVSHHLQELVKAGMITGEAEGKHVLYRLDTAHILAMEEVFHHYLLEITARALSQAGEIDGA